MSHYINLLNGSEDAETDDIIQYLCEELPYTWATEYKTNCNRPTDICRIAIGTFEYLFDDPVNLEVINNNMAEKIELRVVAAFGVSVQLKKQRDDYRLRGWIGPTNTIIGTMWDKGHYIAHSIGGAVDHAELNVFRQRRHLNRGWSTQGKLFRTMEKYCFNNPGTFCFNKPNYINNSAKPASFEYGVLTKEKKLWVERFNNSIS